MIIQYYFYFLICKYYLQFTYIVNILFRLYFNRYIIFSFLFETFPGTSVSETTEKNTGSFRYTFQWSRNVKQLPARFLSGETILEVYAYFKQRKQGTEIVPSPCDSQIIF